VSVLSGEDHYSTLDGMIPNQKCSGNIRLLSSDFRLSERLFIAPGYIHLIPFIRSDRILDIFGEKYFMPDDVE